MKVMTVADIKRLRGDAPLATHLARFETANDRGAKAVLDIRCPECGAAPAVNCYAGS